MNVYQIAQEDFLNWAQQLQQNILTEQSNLMHSYNHYFPQDNSFLDDLRRFAGQVALELEPLVMENNSDANLPKLDHYTAFGQPQDRVLHHSSYIEAGNIIYGSDLMKYLLKPGHLLKTLSLFLLSSHAGEAGHNCPIACSAGIIRILQNCSIHPETDYFLKMLTESSFSNNFTGAQFLTEIQGGSDVGANATIAYQDDQNNWFIQGEKWFCSNANADLILLTARFNQELKGTKGLGLFLVPAKLADGQSNAYHIKRLKQKIGTRSMATAEINFNGALAFPMGELTAGIHLVMENVLHLSRIFNAFSVLGMARRAQQIAYYYACNREAFGQKIINFPLVKERVAAIAAENTAQLAAIFEMVKLQDQYDTSLDESNTSKLLLRTLANLNKFFTAKRAVENIHHCLDILAGNGTIETFSSLPRLLRDSIVCENWEGTHFTLWMQTLKDIHKFNIDTLFVEYLSAKANLCRQKDEYAIFAREIDNLNQAFQTLRRLPPDIQSLKIQTIIEQMVYLNTALALMIETLDPQAPLSKKACLRWFIKNYITHEEIAMNDYFMLLDEILNELSITHGVRDKPRNGFREN